MNRELRATLVGLSLAMAAIAPLPAQALGAVVRFDPFRTVQDRVTDPKSPGFMTGLSVMTERTRTATMGIAARHFWKIGRSTSSPIFPRNLLPSA